MDGWLGGSIGGHKVVVKGNSNSAVNLNLAEQNLSSTDTPLQNVFKSASRAASKVFDSSGDLFSAPGNWINNMKENFSTYLIFGSITIIGLCFLYCVIRWHLYRCSNGFNMPNVPSLSNTTNSSNLLQQLQQFELQLKQLQLQQQQQQQLQQTSNSPTSAITTNTSP